MTTFNYKISSSRISFLLLFISTFYGSTVCRNTGMEFFKLEIIKIFRFKSWEIFHRAFENKTERLVKFLNWQARLIDKWELNVFFENKFWVEKLSSNLHNCFDTLHQKWTRRCCFFFKLANLKSAHFLQTFTKFYKVLRFTRE